MSAIGAALAHHRAGRLEEAESIYREILAANPRHADSLHLLGMIECARGRYAAAADLIRQAIAIDDSQPAYHVNLGTVLQAQGDVEEALRNFQRALALDPNLFEAHVNAANIFQFQGQFEPVVEHLRRALAIREDYAEAHHNLGIALMTLDHAAEAIGHYQRALALDPVLTGARNNLGIALAAHGRIADAIVEYRGAIDQNPRDANALNNLALALAAEDRTEEAIEHYERALALQPEHAEAHNNLGNALKSLGKFEPARRHYRRAIAARPDYVEPHYNLSEITKFRAGDGAFAVLASLAARLPEKKSFYAHFALAKACDDAGDYDRAWLHLQKANALRRAQVRYDEASTLRLFTRIKHVFDVNLRHFGHPSETPVFVVGMPRSGSTLVEQILASHPRIHAAGELKVLEKTAAAIGYPECARTLDGAGMKQLGEHYLSSLPPVGQAIARIVDKLPGNFLNLGLIRMILPNARIIHTARDPMDTCFSCYSRLFTEGLDFTYDLQELARYYGAYRELMEHWRSLRIDMLDVAYEDVVNDLEGQARRLIEYCGLEWDARCLAFHETDRSVRTASAAQVRQPVYRASIGRWRKYESHLTPLTQNVVKCDFKQNESGG